MAFRFSLEAVLRVRERREEAAALELAASQRERGRQEELLAALDEERQRHRRELRKLARRGLLARDLLLHQDYERGLGLRLERERCRLAELEAACEERRQKLLARARDKKVLEKLRERQRRAWRLEELRVEQKGLDDLSGRLPGPEERHGRVD